jgi:hypothetical protein
MRQATGDALSQPAAKLRAKQQMTVSSSQPNTPLSCKLDRPASRVRDHPRRKLFRLRSHVLHAHMPGTPEPAESFLRCVTCRMLAMQVDNLLLQYSNVTRSLELVNGLLKIRPEPFEALITRCFIGQWNEKLAKFTPY